MFINNSFDTEYKKFSESPKANLKSLDRLLPTLTVSHRKKSEYFTLFYFTIYYYIVSTEVSIVRLKFLRTTLLFTYTYVHIVFVTPRSFTEY